MELSSIDGKLLGCNSSFTLRILLSVIIDWSESGLSRFKAEMNKYPFLEPKVLMEEGDFFAELEIQSFSNPF